ncbi:MAG: DUF45 domain-containing protein, partial [Anaerolineae bacterium]|nr:DUF45 domain-containing protein [Anaerolineae bacterium]
MANGNGKQSTTFSQDEINGILWRACDTFRGAVDPSEYKNYILVMLFVKYISDVWQDHYDSLKKEYGDDEERIRRRLAKANRHGIDADNFEIRRMKNRWGSCTKEGHILLNPDLIIAPKMCIEYVIVHELCHLQEHNHGP